MTIPEHQQAERAFEAFLLRNGDPSQLSEPMREILRLFYKDGWQAALEWKARADVVPLTKDEILSEFCCTPGVRQHVEAFVAGARFAEKHHGIAASQDSAKGGK